MAERAVPEALAAPGEPVALAVLMLADQAVLAVRPAALPETAATAARAADPVMETEMVMGTATTMIMATNAMQSVVLEKSSCATPLQEIPANGIPSAWADAHHARTRATEIRSGHANDRS
jgi:hypothetical protein